MTVRGRGSARSATTSIRPADATRSRRASTCAWIRGRSASTARGVNARLTASRSRVWCGGSRKSIDCRWPPAVRAHAVWLGREVSLEPLAPEPRVAEDGGDVRVAREDPEPVRRAVDRILGTELRVERIRVPGSNRRDRATELLVVGSLRRSALGRQWLVSIERDAHHAREGQDEASPAGARSRLQTCCGAAAYGPKARPVSPAIPRESTAFPPRGGFAAVLRADLGPQRSRTSRRQQDQGRVPQPRVGMRQRFLRPRDSGIQGSRPSAAAVTGAALAQTSGMDEDNTGAHEAMRPWTRKGASLAPRPDTEVRQAC